MNPEISKLFDLIELYQNEILKLEHHNPKNCELCAPSLKMIEIFKKDIREISSALNPQIPEPYASMTAESIISSMGQYKGVA